MVMDHEDWLGGRGGKEISRRREVMGNCMGGGKGIYSIKEVRRMSAWLHGRKKRQGGLMRWSHGIVWEEEDSVFSGSRRKGWEEERKTGVTERWLIGFRWRGRGNMGGIKGEFPEKRK
jgi:hypothetical protein